MKNNISQTIPIEARSNIALIDISSNGKILIIVDVEGYCLIINYNKLSIISHFNFRGKVSCMKISPDNNFLAVSIDRSLKIYSMPDIKKEFEPFVLYKNYTAWHNDKITCINWSGDSRFVLTGSKDTSVRLLNIFKIKDYIPLCFSGHKKRIVNCIFSEDMNRIYSISQDGIMFIWKYINEKSDAFIKAQYYDKRVKNNKNLKSKYQLNNDSENESEDDDNDNSDNEYYSEYEKKIITGRYILEKKQQFITNSKVVICEINQSYEQRDNLLVLGLQSGEFSIYSMNNFENKYTLQISESKITSISINKTGKWIAFGNKYLDQLLVWDWKSESYIYKQKGHFYDITTIAYSPDSSQLASGANDGRIKIWDSSNCICIITFKEHQSKVTGIQYATNKPNVLISSSLDGTVRAYDLNKYINFRIMTTPLPTKFSCCAIDFSGDIVTAGCVDNYNIYVWNLKNGDLIDTLSGHTAPVTSLQFSLNKDMLISGSWDNSVKIWELYTKSGNVESFQHNSKIISISLCPNDKEVAVSTLNGELYTWDIETGAIRNIIDISRDIWGGRLKEERQTAKNSKRTKHLNSICYNLSGNLLICGGNSQYVLIYDMVYQILVKKFVLTYNRSLNGLLYKLNSSKIDKPNDYYDSEDELEMQRIQKKILPGTNTTIESNNKMNPEIKITCVQFANTNRSWAVGTTEGIYIYSLDKSLSFSKLSLDINITSKDAENEYINKSFLKAIVYSVFLNKLELFEKYFITIPKSQITMICNKLPFNVVEPLLNYFSSKIINEINIELSLMWIFNIIKTFGEQLKMLKNKNVFLNLQKSLNKVFIGLEGLVNDNIFTIKYLTEKVDIVEEPDN